MKYFYKLFVWLPTQLIEHKMFKEFLSFLFLGYIEGITVPNPNLRNRKTSLISVVGFLLSVFSVFCFFSLVASVAASLFHRAPLSASTAGLFAGFFVLSLISVLSLTAIQTKYRSDLKSRLLSVEATVLYVSGRLSEDIDRSREMRVKSDLLKYARKYTRENISDEEKVEFIFDTLRWVRLADSGQLEKEDSICESELLQELEREVSEYAFSAVRGSRRKRGSLL